MASDTLTGWTLERLIIELADAVALASYDATGKASVPTDVNLLDQLTRCVNRGYKMFLRENPRWTFLERVVRLTLSADGTAGECIDGDPGRYLLPSYVTGSPKSDWTFKDQLTDEWKIINIDAISVTRMRDSAKVTSGTPTYGAVRSLEPVQAGSQRPTRRELLVYPSPDRDYVIEAEFRLHPPDLADLDDQHIAGAEHDLAILEQAVYDFRKQDNPGMERPTTELAKSIELDNASRPRMAGQMKSTFQTQQGQTARLTCRRTILVNDQPI